MYSFKRVPFWSPSCRRCYAGEYFGLDEAGYERAVTDRCLRMSAHQLPDRETYQSQLTYTPYTVHMGQLTLYR